MDQKTELKVVDKVAVKDLPMILDPYPQQDAKFTRISKFFDNLKLGKLTTTKCKQRKCGALHWPPRVVCPKCLSEELEWIELPSTGTIWASSALVLGHPIGFENEGPFCTAMVELDGAGLRIFTRVDGCAAGELKIGDAVRLKLLELSDGRAWFRFELIH